MAEANPYIGKSPAELKRQMDLITQAMEAEAVGSDVAHMIALKVALKHLKGRNKLGAGWDVITPQMLPKEGLAGKVGGFSETEVSNIEKAVIAGIEAASKNR